MADIGVQFTLNTGGGNITFNAGGLDQIYLMTIMGLGGPPVRAQVDEVPFGHGGIFHDFWRGPRHILMEGMFLIQSTRIQNDIVIIRNTYEESLRAALSSIMQVDGTLVWTPQGQAQRTLTVRHDVQLEFPHDQEWLVENFSFGLVAADPDWT